MNSAQPLTKTDAAYQDIRVAIESGRLAPGTRILIGDLEELLGMSPTPIREALRLLQRDGLVEHTPHLGTVVASFTADRVAENHRIRSVLETLATELATERASEAEIAQIRKLHEQFKQAVADDPVGRRPPRLNSEWHMAIYRAAHSDQLLKFIERLWLIRGRTKFFSIHGPRSVREHDAVLRQMEARHPAEAARLMGEHLGSVDAQLEDQAPKSSAGDLE